LDFYGFSQNRAGAPARAYPTWIRQIFGGKIASVGVFVSVSIEILPPPEKFQLASFTIFSRFFL
jgi:hypothetical protein